MQADLAQRIAAHPKYQELKSKRTSFGWVLTIAMLVVYFGFILLVVSIVLFGIRACLKAYREAHPTAQETARPRRGAPAHGRRR